MGVNSLPKTVTRQRRDCDLNPGCSAPESSTLTTRLPSHPILHDPLNKLGARPSTSYTRPAGHLVELMLVRLRFVILMTDTWRVKR